MSNPKICLVIDTPDSGSDIIIKDLIEGCEYKSSAVVSIGSELTEDLMGKEIIFFKAQPESDLQDQIEAFSGLMEANELQVERSLCFLNSEMLMNREDLEPWFEAAIYFSDYVFLMNTQPVPHDFGAKYIKNYKEEKCIPCFFEEVKKDKVKNPYLVMDNEPRRLTHLFDDTDVYDEMDLDEDNLPDEPFIIDHVTDKYLKRNEEGNRLIELPPLTNE